LKTLRVSTARFLSLLLLLALVTCAFAAEWPGEATVQSVTDGDTIVVKLRTAQTVHVRVVGIDTPELGRDGRKDQPGAVAAKNRLTELVKGRTVNLVYDALSNREDRYGRQLCYVELDGRDIGLQLLVEGHAALMTRFAFARYDLYVKSMLSRSQ